MDHEKEVGMGTSSLVDIWNIIYDRREVDFSVALGETGIRYISESPQIFGMTTHHPWQDADVASNSLFSDSVTLITTHFPFEELGSSMSSLFPPLLIWHFLPS